MGPAVPSTAAVRVASGCTDTAQEQLWLQLEGTEVLLSGAGSGTVMLLLRHPGWPWLSILCPQLPQEPEPCGSCLGLSVPAPAPTRALPWSLGSALTGSDSPGALWPLRCSVGHGQGLLLCSTGFYSVLNATAGASSRCQNKHSCSEANLGID